MTTLSLKLVKHHVKDSSATREGFFIDLDVEEDCILKQPFSMETSYQERFSIMKLKVLANKTKDIFIRTQELDKYRETLELLVKALSDVNEVVMSDEYATNLMFAPLGKEELLEDGLKRSKLELRVKGSSKLIDVEYY